MESFLLSDIPLEQSSFYKKLEVQKDRKEYLEKVKDGIDLLKEKNSNEDICKQKLDYWRLLSELRKYILDQSVDLKNRDRKIIALDEYFKIGRYKNDGKLWTSGFEFNFYDAQNIDNFNMVILKKQKVPKRAIDDIGLESGSFIKILSSSVNYNEDNYSILSEQEKQDIYLAYHDELPWDLEITCSLEFPYNDDKEDIRLVRPENTHPCGKQFHVKESEIFILPYDKTYRYFQVCPNCGWITNIPKEILSEEVKHRIESRSIKEPNLFNKMRTYSEQFSLQNQRKIN